MTENQLRLWAEPFPKAGGFVASAADAALGDAAALDRWEVFVREVLQNSWDARLGDRIEFEIQGVVLTGEAEDVLRGLAGEGADPLSVALRAHPRGQGIPCLKVKDFGTVGLCGPTDGSQSGEGRTHFADFFRNIGRGGDRDVGGGTFGFGKAVLYTAGAASTLIAYSKTTAVCGRGEPETRLMGAARGTDFTNDGRRFTGRYFWGRANPELGVDPLLNRSADAVAGALGLSDRRYEHSLGTTMLVPLPYAVVDGTDATSDVCRSEADLRGVLEACSQALVRHAWPLLLRDRPSGVDAVVTLGDVVIGPSRPEESPELRHFVRAYQSATSGRPGRDGLVRAEVIRSERPSRVLGMLAYWHGIQSPKDDESLTNCIALMRGPRLVVNYRPVRVSQGAVRGVFVVASDADLEQLFARAEPATHDSWIPERVGLLSKQRNLVRICLSRLDAYFATRAAESHGPSLARLGDSLGAALFGKGDRVGIAHTDERRDRVQESASKEGTGLVFKFVGPPVLAREGTETVARFAVDLSNAKQQRSVDVTASAVILDEGGRPERAFLDGELKEGADPAAITGWWFGSTLIRGGRLRFKPGADFDPIKIEVNVPPGCSVAVDLRQEVVNDDA